MDDASPSPERGDDRPGRTFRIRGLMLAIVGIAVWLALFREWPAPAVFVAVLAVPTLAINRWFLKEDERERGRHPDVVARSLLLLVSALLAMVCMMSVGFLLLALVVIISKM